MDRADSWTPSSRSLWLPFTLEVTPMKPSSSPTQFPAFFTFVPAHSFGLSHAASNSKGGCAIGDSLCPSLSSSFSELSVATASFHIHITPGNCRASAEALCLFFSFLAKLRQVLTYGPRLPVSGSCSPFFEDADPPQVRFHCCPAAALFPSSDPACLRVLSPRLACLVFSTGAPSSPRF